MTCHSADPELSQQDQNKRTTSTSLWIHHHQYAQQPPPNSPPPTPTPTTSTKTSSAADAELLIPTFLVASPSKRRISFYTRGQVIVLFLFFCLYLFAFCNRTLLQHPLVDSDPALPCSSKGSSGGGLRGAANWSSEEQDYNDVPVRVPHFQKTKRHLPQCIIIGVRKCGTRALLEFLNLHPQIQKAAEEVHFFDDERRYGLGLDWYRRRMPYTFPEQITIEKSPAYFVTPRAPSRIRAMNESTRLLVILRDPVVRVISDYAQIHWNRLQKGKPHVPFEKLVLTPDGQVNPQYKAIQISMYSKYLKLWYREFPKEQIHIVSGDAFIQDPLQELRRIEDFLHLEHKINKHNFYFNKTKGFYCLRNETTEKCLSDTKGRKHPVVSEKVVRTLRKFFRPYNEEAFQLIGRDMGWKV